MPNKIRLRVATPDDVKFDDDVELIIVRAITGDMGFLAHHEANSAILDYGILRILSDNNERRMAVFGGMSQVHDNTVTIIANDAQWPEDIDVPAVKAERERLANKPQEELDALEIKKDQIMMRRALLQLEVGGYQVSSRIQHMENNE